MPTWLHAGLLVQSTKTILHQREGTQHQIHSKQPDSFISTKTGGNEALERLRANYWGRETEKEGGHEFHETCHSVTFYFMKRDFKRCCDTITLESMHTKDESKRSSAFAFIFGVN